MIEELQYADACSFNAVYYFRYKEYRVHVGYLNYTDMTKFKSSMKQEKTRI